MAEKTVRRKGELVKFEEAMLRAKDETICFGEELYEEFEHLTNEEMHKYLGNLVRNLRRAVPERTYYDEIPGYIGIALSIARDLELQLSGNFMGWIYTVALRKYLDDHPIPRVRFGPLLEESESMPTEPTWFSESEIEDWETRREWTQKLAILDRLVPFGPEERKIFNLAMSEILFRGRQFDQGAVVTGSGLTPNAVKAGIANYKRRLDNFGKRYGVTRAEVKRWLFKGGSLPAALSSMLGTRASVLRRVRRKTGCIEGDCGK